MQENKTAPEQEKTAAGNTETAEKDEKLYSQAELDERVNAECEKLKKKLAEAEKLSGMSEKERAEHKRSMREKELAERGAAVERRELIADAADILAEAGLPKQLAACLNYSGKEECGKSLAAVTKAFEEAVAAAVNTRLRGGTPKHVYNGAKDAFLDGLGV